MAKFEVHIPGDEGLNVTFRVDATNWMAALKIGMQKLGEQGSSVQNVLVDIQDDNSVHVTESQTGRVFRIRELSDAEAAAAQVKKTTDRRPSLGGTPLPPPARPDAKTLVDLPALQPLPIRPDGSPAGEPFAQAREQTAPDARPPTPAAKLDPAVLLATVSEVSPRGMGGGAGLAYSSEGTPMRPVDIGRADVLAKGPSKGHRAHEAQAVVELEKPATPVAGPIGRPRVARKDKKLELEDMLADVFERVQEVYTKDSVQSALYFLLDLALEKIPSEAGSVYQADAGTGDLTFVAVRGPRASEILQAKITVPSGTGIVGFCATEGVSLALSEVQKDPRYYSAVSEKVNFETRSVICSPIISHGRTFGCVQLINKKGNATFTDHEVGLLHYVAHQAALYLNARS